MSPPVKTERGRGERGGRGRERGEGGDREGGRQREKERERGGRQRERERERANTGDILFSCAACYGPGTLFVSII